MAPIIDSDDSGDFMEQIPVAQSVPISIPGNPHMKPRSSNRPKKRVREIK